MQPTSSKDRAQRDDGADPRRSRAGRVDACQFGTRACRRGYNRLHVKPALPVGVRRALWGAAWAITAVLASFAAMRLVWHDGLWVFMLGNGLTPYLYLPVWPVAAAAIVARRTRLAMLAGVIAALHGYWTITPLLPRAAAATAGRRLRVVSANLLMVHEAPARLADELDRLDADVYFLQELSPHWDDELDRRGFWRRYPFNKRLTSDDSFGTAIASRFPVRDLDVFWSAELPQMRGVLRVDDRDIELLNVHLLPPRSLDYVPYYRQGANDLVAIVQRLGGKSFIVAGDFNSTPDSSFAARMRGLSDDAWEAAGSGFGFTWPNGMFSLPPMRLDHVFVSPDLGVLRATLGVGLGSDHRPIVADVARRAR
jgi:endonuclease/exonuclease/phosphatase (EEP) superfamily protein YafD